MEEKVVAQHALIEKLKAASSDKQRLEELLGEKNTVTKETVEQRLSLVAQLNELQQLKERTTKETLAPEQLVNTKTKEAETLQAALLKSKAAVEDAKRLQVKKEQVSRAKQEEVKTVQVKLRKLEADMAKSAQAKTSDSAQNDLEERKESLEKERSQLELDVKLAEMESATQGKLAVAKGQEQASLEAHLKAAQSTLITLKGELSTKQKSVQESLQKQSGQEAAIQKRLSSLDNTLSKLESDKVNALERKKGKESEIQQLSEQIESSGPDQEKLKSDIAEVASRIQQSVDEENIVRSQVEAMRNESEQQQKLINTNKETEKLAAAELNEIPEKIKATQLKQRKFQTEKSDLEVEKGLKLGQQQTVQEQLSSERLEKETLLKAQLEDKNPLDEKLSARQNLEDAMGGTAEEKAKLRDLSSKIDGLNQREANGSKFIDSLHKMSEDRSRKVDESKQKFFKSYQDSVDAITAQLEEARTVRAQLGES